MEEDGDPREQSIFPIQKHPPLLPKNKQNMIYGTIGAHSWCLLVVYGCTHPSCTLSMSLLRSRKERTIAYFVFVFVRFFIRFDLLRVP